MPKTMNRQKLKCDRHKCRSQKTYEREFNEQI